MPVSKSLRLLWARKGARRPPRRKPREPQPELDPISEDLAAIFKRQEEDLSPTSKLDVEEETTPPRPYKLNLTKDRLQVAITPDIVKHFAFIYLRDSCSCSRCVDPSTKQKTFQTSDIPVNLRARKLKVHENEVIECKWHNDVPGFGPDHTSLYPRSFFHDYLTRDDRVLARFNHKPRSHWNRRRMEKEGKWMSYKSYMNSDQSLHEALTQLSRYGLLFLTDVPSSEESVINIGMRIGPLRDTFYGRTWDVKSVPDAKNVAYTHQNLGLHMDLLYMREPPGLQLLHCLRASCSGGNSLFADSYRAVNEIRKNYPAHFKSLLDFPVTFHYRNAGHHYHCTRPTVELTRFGYTQEAPYIHAVNWAPPFQGPFEINTGTDRGISGLRIYLEAAKHIAGLCEAPSALYEQRLEEGHCVIFNNRRVLHARRAFDIGTGERWLKGAYLDTDVFSSRLRVLDETFQQTEEIEETEETWET
ncbi:MAG: hypothetical protein M1830_002930 [Pleopsidium flavum]|nr:MAG: hypothetical protein M1830_002930 [Pleopsidium flavum]